MKRTDGRNFTFGVCRKDVPDNIADCDHVRIFWDGLAFTAFMKSVSVSGVGIEIEVERSSAYEFREGHQLSQLTQSLLRFSSGR